MSATEKEITRKPGTSREVSRKPGSRPLTPFDEFDRLMEGFFPRGWLSPFRRDWAEWPASLIPFEGRTPRVDVIDQEDKVIVRAEVPGVKKDDLDVSLSDDAVTIRGTTRHEEEKKEGEYYRRELSEGEFSRTVPLPADVDGEKAKASFSDGILELTLPKQEKSRRHKIEVT